MRNIEIEYTNVFEKHMDCKAETITHVGGARSSKSYSLSQFINTIMVGQRNKKILVTRKTFPSLRITAMKTIIDLAKQYGYYDWAKHNKTNNELTYKDNYLLFSSIDDPEKIKSTEFNYIWMEEANEFTYDDYMILKMRLSGAKKDTELNQMFLSLNPNDERGWIPEKLLPQRGTEVIRSTYLDNPFLPKEYIKSLESLKETDPDYWKIYGLGEWGQAKSLIYANWDLIDDFPANCEEIFYGLDFGFNNPSALIKIGLKDQVYYEQEQFYERNLTNTDLIGRLESLDINRNDFIFADAAEPARIQEIKQAGFNIHPADKSVKDGIDYVKRHRVHITKDSVNHIKEKRAYKYKEDKNGNVTDEPLKWDDHLQDAERYALYTFSKKVTFDWASAFSTGTARTESLL